MPENPTRQEDRSVVSPKDGDPAPQPATSPHPDAPARDTGEPEDEKRIERYPER